MIGAGVSLSKIKRYFARVLFQMSMRLVLRLVVIVLAVLLPLVGVAFAVAPVLPQAGQLSYSAGSRIYLLDVARGLPVVLLDDSLRPPLWSPDGQQMVYVQQTGTEATMADNVMYAADFARAARVLLAGSGDGAFVEHFPVWSPFAPQVAFTYVQPESDRLELAVVQPDKGILRTANVANLIPRSSELAWTAADRLRYVTVGSGTVRLNELNLETMQREVVHRWPFETMTARLPAMSADGERFILPAITPDALNFELYLFDNRTDDIRNLSNRSSHMDTNAIWSPDEQYVMFRSLNDAGQFVVLMAADGSQQSTLYRTSGALFSQLTWSPDGRFASVIMNQSGQKHLCIIALADAAVTCPAEDVDQAMWRPLP